MKRITVSVTVDYAYGETTKKIKNALAEAALTQVAINRLDLVAIDAKVGNVRSK